MARSIEIRVEASLGDTLVKLGLAKAAVEDLKKSTDGAGRSLSGDKNSFESKLGLVGNAMYGMRKAVTDTAKSLGDFLYNASALGSPLESLGASLTSLAPLLGLVADGAVLVVIALSAYPVIVAAATFAIVALTDILSTLVVIVADMTGPVAILAALLGGLGFGFYQSFQMALKSKSGFAALKEGVSQLGGEFSHLGRNLAHDFMPYFLGLIHAASVALSYFTKLSTMPLSQAFQSLSTTGVQMLQQFAEHVGAVIGPVIRLAIRTAFSPSSSGLDGMLSGDLSQIKRFLFGGGGANRAKAGNIPIGVRLAPGAVSGALQPFIDWWHRHDFTAQGEHLARQVWQGIKTSGALDNFTNYVKNIAKDAGTAAADAFVSALKTEAAKILPGIISWIAGQFQGALNFGPGGPSKGAPPSSQTGSPGPGVRGQLGGPHGGGGARNGVNLHISFHSHTAPTFAQQRQIANNMTRQIGVAGARLA